MPEPPPNRFGDIEVVVMDGNRPVHFYRDQNECLDRRGRITEKAEAPAAILQNHDGGLEALVRKGGKLIHY